MSEFYVIDIQIVDNLIFDFRSKCQLEKGVKFEIEFEFQLKN